MSYPRRDRNPTPQPSDDGRTKQSFQFDADPKTLMKQFSKTGKREIFEQTEKLAMHGDFSNIPDFFTALLQVQEVKQDYEDLPINIKRATHNSPMEFFELVSDPNRVDQCIELGIYERDTEEPKHDIPPSPDRAESPTSEPSTSTPLGLTGTTGPSTKTGQ